MTPEETKALIDRARTAADVVSSVTVLRHTIRDLCDALSALSSHPAEETGDSRGDKLERAIGRVRGNPNYATNADKAIADEIKAGRGLDLVNRTVEWGFRSRTRTETVTMVGAVVGPYSSKEDARMIGGGDVELMSRRVSSWSPATADREGA